MVRSGARSWHARAAGRLGTAPNVRGVTRVSWSSAPQSASIPLDSRSSKRIARSRSEAQVFEIVGPERLASRHPVEEPSAGAPQSQTPFLAPRSRFAGKARVALFGTAWHSTDVLSSRSRSTSALRHSLGWPCVLDAMQLMIVTAAERLRPAASVQWTAAASRSSDPQRGAFATLPPARPLKLVYQAINVMAPPPCCGLHVL